MVIFILRRLHLRFTYIKKTYINLIEKWPSNQQDFNNHHTMCNRNDDNHDDNDVSNDDVVDIGTTTVMMTVMK